jgi:UDP-N-acetylglucosamine/UDP-N-acetylgalactosamine diphosphorylase
LAEVTEFFRHTIASANEEEEKLDEHLQPIPPELHGAITRTSPELLRHYEHLGERI